MPTMRPREPPPRSSPQLQLGIITCSAYEPNPLTSVPRGHVPLACPDATKSGFPPGRSYRLLSARQPSPTRTPPRTAQTPTKLVSTAPSRSHDYDVALLRRLSRSRPCRCRCTASQPAAHAVHEHLRDQRGRSEAASSRNTPARA